MGSTFGAPLEAFWPVYAATIWRCDVRCDMTLGVDSDPEIAYNG